jgi:hypothetical protein
MFQSSEKRELIQKIKQQLVNCIGYQGDELQKSREDAYNYYFQRPRGDEVAGRSSIVTGDLSSMVEGNLAQMTEPLASKRIAEYCAYDASDEEQSQIESDCVNELVFNRQNGFIQVTSAIKSAMLLRNAVVKIWVDSRTHKQLVSKDNVDPAVINEVLDSIKQSQSAKGTAVDVAVHTYDQKKKKFSATVTKTTKRFAVEAIAPENLLVPKNWDKHDFMGISFLAERHVEPRAILVERGFDKGLVKSCARFNNGKYQQMQNSRLPNGLTPFTMPIDSSQEEVEWFECYVLLDDGDGASELRCISVCGNIMLDDEPADTICYAAGAIIINPHSYVAISLYDKLKSTQDSTTAMTRALHDNLNATNKNRTAHFDGVVEETDLTDGRTNGSIRVKQGVGIMDVRQAITAFGVPDTSANILANLDYARKVRSEMGGATLDMATGQMQMSDRMGSQGLDRAYSVMEQLASYMTKTIANTLIRSIYLIAHEVLRTQWRGPISFKRGNRWIEQNPSKWQVRDAVKVNLGASIGERTRQSVVYEKIMMKQEALAGAGMEQILVDATSYYKAVCAWMRVNDIQNPEQFFIDPRSPQSVDAFKRKAVQGQVAQQKQDGLMQQAVALEQVRAAISKYQTDVETQFKYYDATLSAQVEEAKLSVQGVIDFLKTKATASKVTDDKPGGKKETSPSDKSKSATVGDIDRVSS